MKRNNQSTTFLRTTKALTYADAIASVLPTDGECCALCIQSRVNYTLETTEKNTN